MHRDGGKDRLRWLADIYRTYAADLQRSIASKVGDPFLAEDLTSIVFLKALRWLRADKSAESVRGWLYATARTTIVDHWQSLGQYETRTLADLDNHSASSSDNEEVARQQADLRVQHLLSLLPEREREVLELRYLRGYNAAEIAEALGTNAGHIRVLQLRALRRAAQLERQERNIAIMQEQESSFDSSIQLLTPESRKVLELAYQEAQNLNHHFIGTEHILWGLVSEGSLASFFTPQGVTPEVVHAGLVFIYERQPHGQWLGKQEESSPDTQPDLLKLLTLRTKQMIGLAGEEAKSQGEKSIQPAHLLLGMLDEGGGMGASLLRSRWGINLVQARAALASAPATQICSFCGRAGTAVRHLFPAESSPGSATPAPVICDICVEQFHTMIGQG